MTTSHFALPDVGEGLTEAEIVSWKVAPGDEVEVNQVIVEIETAKSLVELPSPYAGTVSALLVAEGDTVAVGTPIFAVASTSTEQLTSPLQTPAQAASPVEVQVREEGEQAEEGSGAVLVGYGVDSHAKSRRGQRRGPVVSPVPPREAVAAPVKPPIRKLAKDLGVDLGRVAPSGAVRRGDARRRAAREAAGERVPQRGDAGVAGQPRGAHPRQGHPEGDRRPRW